MAEKTLVQKFKAVTDCTEKDQELYYDFLFTDKGSLYQGWSFTMKPSQSDLLMIEVITNGATTKIVQHNEHMEVTVTRDSDTYNFNLDYDHEGDWIFQLSTQYDVGFLEGKYMKYLRKLRKLYYKEAETC